MSAHLSSICRYFAATGHCYYGDQCNFVHSFQPNQTRPSTENISTSLGTSSSAHLSKNQRPCRNIEIYGYCKFAGKTCEYNHDVDVAKLKEEAPTSVQQQIEQEPNNWNDPHQSQKETSPALEYVSIKERKKELEPRGRSFAPNDGYNAAAGPLMATSQSFDYSTQQRPMPGMRPPQRARSQPFSAVLKPGIENQVQYSSKDIQHGRLMKKPGHSYPLTCQPAVHGVCL